MRFILFMLDAPPRRMGTSKKVFEIVRRGTFFAMNSVFTILFALVIVALINGSKVVDLLPRTYFILTVAISILRIIEGICGLLPTLERTYKISLVLFTFLHIISSSMISTCAYWSHQYGMEGIFLKHMQSYTAHNTSSHSMALDWLQTKYQCCGWSYYFDYYRVNQLTQFPTSCCKNTTSVDACAANMPEDFQRLHLMGCGDTICSKYLRWYLISAAGIAAIDAIMLIIAISLYKSVSCKYTFDIFRKNGFERRLQRYFEKRTRYCIHALQKLGAPVPSTELERLKTTIRQIIEEEYRTNSTMDVLTRQGVSVKRISQLGFDVAFEDSKAQTKQSRPGLYILEGAGLVGQVKVKPIKKSESGERSRSVIRSNASLFSRVLKSPSRRKEHLTKASSPAAIAESEKTVGALATIERRHQQREAMLSEGIKSDDLEPVKINSACMRINKDIIGRVAESVDEKPLSNTSVRSRASTDSLKITLSADDTQAASKILEKYRSRLMASPSEWANRGASVESVHPVVSFNSDPQLSKEPP